jgi:hypothetical protein
LAGSRPRKKRTDLKLLLSPFAGRSKMRDEFFDESANRKLARDGVKEVGQIGTDKSASGKCRNRG